MQGLKVEIFDWKVYFHINHIFIKETKKSSQFLHSQPLNIIFVDNNSNAVEVLLRYYETLPC